MTRTCTTTSADGTAGRSATITRDATAPTNVRFAAAVPASGGGSRPTTAPGTRTLTATATDAAGSTATATRTRSVRVPAASGFAQPVAIGGGVNTVKGGSTVPLKFAVADAGVAQTSTGVVASFTQRAVTCGTLGGATDDIEIVTTGGTGLRYDATAGQFIQNWQTPKQPGTCYIVTVTMIDGTAISANFKLK